MLVAIQTWVGQHGLTLHPEVCVSNPNRDQTPCGRVLPAGVHAIASLRHAAVLGDTEHDEIGRFRRRRRSKPD